MSGLDNLPNTKTQIFAPMAEVTELDKLSASMDRLYVEHFEKLHTLTLTLASLAEQIQSLLNIKQERTPLQESRLNF